ncbi:sin3 histone deacetylase corepressor complex component SDS3-like isoform X1 [Lytechinus variegatus]|uniref:sin3 histone deacetylase corepressor complex component SDS3-like isoform X1 n=1 Tax=Lytechinus variegatus TaxID=7654 RepID=UPI001BB271EF|nr:sin3 histone deacetylase corepressor complex component SDS3-like isoform X1 [Lytechinus variegatus]
MSIMLGNKSLPNGVDPAREYEFSDSEDIRDKRTTAQQESDEDTEDASETDAAKLEEEYTEMKEMIYKEKLATLKKQLQQVMDGTHPELNKKLKKMEQQFKERLRMAEIAKQVEMELVEREYLKDQKNAGKDFELKKVDLMETLLLDLDDRRRMIEIEHQSMELTGDSMEIKPVITRKLRRRPNDPIPLPEKRRKPTPGQFCYTLNDDEIAADLKALTKTKSGTTKKSGSMRKSAEKSSPWKPKSSWKPKTSMKSHSNHGHHNHGSSSGAASNITGSTTTGSTTTATGSTNTTTTSSGSHSAGSNSNHKYNVRIEDGKLFYEKRWFHRGQNVYVESKDMGKVSAIVTSIGQIEIWVKKTLDNQKMRIYVTQMQKGKYKIRKRST